MAAKKRVVNTSKLDNEVERMARKRIQLPHSSLGTQSRAQLGSDIAREVLMNKTVKSDPNAASVKQLDGNTRLINSMRRARTASAGGSDAWAALPRFYDPMEYWDISGLPWNMADEGHRRKLHKWLRLFYSTHYLIPILIDIFTRFPLVGMELYCKDQKLADFYEELFFNKLDYPNFLVSLGREFWTVGEAFALGSFDEDLGVWEREELINPEDVVIKNFPLLGSKQMLITPPEYLKKLAQEKSPAREYRQLELNYPELIPYLRKNEHIPVSGVLLKQVANKLTDWDDHGTPILLRGLRTLMHEEKLMASQDAIAERLYSPFILAKLGIQDLGDGQPPWIPDADQLEQVRDDMDIALSSDFRLMVHHFGLDIENVFGREQMPRLGDDFDRIERRIMQIFGVNPSLLSAGAATQPYASSALQAEFLNQILRTFQDYLKAHFESRALVVAEAQEHYDYEMRGSTKVPLYEEVVVYDTEGNKTIETRPKLLIPELQFQTLDLRDEASERQFMQSLRAIGVPLSDKRMMPGVSFDIEDEIHDYNEELVKKTVQQQEAKMKAYTILRERNLPIPPDLKAEVESVLQAPGSPGALPPAATGSDPMGGGPPGGGPTGPTGGPGEGIVMPGAPTGLLGPGGMGNDMTGGGAPAATPQGAMGPGGGSTAPPVSMERRQGMPRPSSVQKFADVSEQDLYQMMADAQTHAEAALNSGDMGEHLRWGREYHEIADAIAHRTGTDPRPANDLPNLRMETNVQFPSQRAPRDVGQENVALQDGDKTAASGSLSTEDKSVIPLPQAAAKKRDEKPKKYSIIDEEFDEGPTDSGGSLGTNGADEEGGATSNREGQDRGGVTGSGASKADRESRSPEASGEPSS